MRLIARWLRFWFGIEALFFVPIFGIQIAILGPALSRTRLLIVSAAFILYAGLTAVTCGAAWWTLKAGKTSARRWALGASVLNFPLIGPGTIACIAGLIVFSRQHVVTEIADPPEAPRLPGDGTSKTGDTIAFVAQIVCLVVAMHWWYAWGRKHGLPIQSQTAGWLQFFVALHVSVLFHEFGHMVAGWACSMKLRQIVLGPVSAMVRSGRWRFTFDIAGLLGRGAAGMVPVDLVDLRRRESIMCIGGPLGSLLCGLVGLAGVLTAKGSPWESWWDCCCMLATFGLIHFVFNLMPARPGSQYSDGARVYQIITGGPWADVEMAFAMVASGLVTPLRPRDLDPDVLRRAVTFIQQGDRAFTLRLFLCFHLLERGETDAAVEVFSLAEPLFSYVPRELAPELLPEMTFIAALYRHDFDAARSYWTQFENSKCKERGVDYWKGRTALLLLDGNVEEAREAWITGKRLADDLPAVGAYEFDRWCFAQLEKALSSFAVTMA